MPVPALIGCHGGGDAAPAQRAVEVGVVTVKPQPVTITTDLPGMTQLAQLIPLSQIRWLHCCVCTVGAGGNSSGAQRSGRPFAPLPGYSSFRERGYSDEPLIEEWGEN